MANKIPMYNILHIYYVYLMQHNGGGGLTKCLTNKI